MRPVQKSTLAFLLATTALVLPALPASAQDATWTSDFLGLWQDGANWSTITPPDASTHAVIPFGEAVIDIPGIAAAARVTVRERGILQFIDDATADNLGVIELRDRLAGDGEIPQLLFWNTTSAGNATVNVSGLGLTSYDDAHVTFNHLSSAGTATITLSNQARLTFLNATTAGSARLTSDASLIRFENDAGAGSAQITSTGASRIEFADNTSAGDATIDLRDRSAAGVPQLQFFNSSSAGNATLNVSGTGNRFYVDASVAFHNDSTAGNATITLSNYGQAVFRDNSTAADARLVSNVSLIGFQNNANAGSAHITNNLGSLVLFVHSATADGATIVNNAGGAVDVSLRSTQLGGNGTPVAIGSLSGAGNIYLGSAGVTLGALNQDDTISGGIGDGYSPQARALLNLTQPPPTGGRLEKVGTGTLTLSGSNSYSGGTTISGGTLVAQGGNAIGDNSSVLVLNGSTLRLLNDERIATLSGSAGDAAATVELNGANLTLGSNSAITTALYWGSITGTGGIVKDGSFGQALAGNNSYDGATQILGGTLYAVGAGMNSIADSSDVTVGAGATLSLVDPSLPFAGLESDGETIGSLAGAGTVDLGVQILTVGGNNASTSFSGLITGSGGLTKTGSGTLILSGSNAAGSQLTGTTTVNQGILRVDGTFGDTAGNAAQVNVASGATLQGNGTIAGDVAVQSNGTLSAGASPGMLTIAGDLTLDSGSTSVFEFGTPNVAGGPTNDLVTVGGNLTMGGMLNVSAASAGYYRLFDVGGTISGAFGTVATPGFTDADVFVIPNQVNLSVRNAGQLLQHWDGPDASGATPGAGGGDGVWDGANTNWTADPIIGAINGAWAGSVAVFGGAAGTVTVAPGTPSFDTLQFNTDGYHLLSGNLAIGVAGANAGNAALTGSIINVTTGTTTINSVIQDGAGNHLNVVGSGTLVLTGANTYTGGTSLLGSRVSVDSDANLGAASGGLTFDGGILQVRGTAFTSTGRTITWGAAGGGFDISSAFNTFTVSQSLGGTGGLSKLGAGTLVLSGANSYSGGTTISQGTLQIGNGGTSGSIAGGVTNNGVLAFNRSDTLAFDGVISGTGALQQIGSGITVLTGSNTYTGGTTITAGTLQVSADANLGTGGLIFNGGTLRTTADMTSGRAVTFTGNGTLLTDAGTTLTLSGGLIGSSGLTKTGAGTLALTGDSSAFTGTTSVGQGVLSVNGRLGGTVEVLTGGRLQGTGTVGTVTVAGAIAPGNSIGTLTVNGNYTQLAGSTYEAEIAPDGSSDRIDVTGAASIQGGTVFAAKVTGSYTPGSRYTLLTAAGGVTGAYAALDQNAPFIDLALGYDPKAVYLDVIRNAVAFPTIGETPNQKAVAAAAESLGEGNALYNAIAGVPDVPSALASFDGLSGEMNASTVTGLLEDSRFVREAMNDRLRSAFETVGAVPLMSYGDDARELATAAVPSERYGAWGSVFGSWGHFDSDGNAAKLSRSVGGFVTGIDGLVTDDIRLGFLAGYSHSSLKVDDRRSSASTDNYHLGIYGGTEWGALAFRSGLAYTWSEIDSSRQVSFPGFTDSLTGDYRAGTTQVFGELGYGIKAGSVALEPFANLAYVHVHTNGFTEQGGASALTVESGSNDVTFTTLGMRASTDFDLGTIKATARGMIGWRHGFGDITPTVSQAFTGSSIFQIAGAPIAKDAATLEAGLDFAIAPRATLGVSYQGQLGSGASDHGVRADFSVNF